MFIIMLILKFRITFLCRFVVWCSARYLLKLWPVSHGQRIWFSRKSDSQLSLESQKRVKQLKVDFYELTDCHEKELHLFNPKNMYQFEGWQKKIQFHNWFLKFFNNNFIIFIYNKFFRPVMERINYRKLKVLYIILITNIYH